MNKNQLLILSLIFVVIISISILALSLNSEIKNIKNNIIFKKTIPLRIKISNSKNDLGFKITNKSLDFGTIPTNGESIKEFKIINKYNRTLNYYLFITGNISNLTIRLNNKEYMKNIKITLKTNETKNIKMVINGNSKEGNYVGSLTIIAYKNNNP